MNTLVLFLLFIVSSSVSFTQQTITFSDQPTKSNFDKAMLLEDLTDAQMDTLYSLSEKYSFLSVDSCVLLANKAFALTSSNPKSHSHIKALTAQADGFRHISQHEESLAKLSSALTYAIELDDKELLAEIYNLQGSNHLSIGESGVAIALFLKGAYILEELGELEELGDEYCNISGLFFDQNDLVKSQEYISKVKSIAETIDNNRLRVEGSGLQAINWMTRGIHYYMENATDSINMSATMDTLYHYFNKSEKEFDRAVGIAKHIKNKTLKISVLNNNVALMLNMEKFDKAEKLSLEAHKTAAELGNINLIIQSKSNLGSYYRRTGNFKLAKQYGVQSLELAKKHKLERKEYVALNALYMLYKETEDWENATKSLDQMRSYEARLAKTERVTSISEAETKYQTALKENTILELENSNAKIYRQKNLILGGSLLSAILLFIGNRFWKMRRERNDKMELAKALLYTQEEERKRIAQDLHDGIGQSLLLIKKQMEANQNTSLENQSMISDTLEEVRSISKGLHPFQLEKFGLTSSINDIIEKIEKSTDIFITKDISDIDGQISKDSEIHLYRVIQEAFNNILKHSEATAAKIDINLDQKDINISIRDNGKGFDHELTISKTRSLGLKTMNERILAIGGKFNISKNTPKGTLLKITIPRKN
ncbi:MAG: signal transduction histidine kinase [Saprospiraceae bacterium]|jgi:signal transduction histidine kinase